MPNNEKYMCVNELKITHNKMCTKTDLGFSGWKLEWILLSQFVDFVVADLAMCVCLINRTNVFQHVYNVKSCVINLVIHQIF